MARLSAATRDLRYRELDLFAKNPTWLDYRLFLFRMYGLHVPVERNLATASLDRVVTDASLRNHKVALLAHDLIALGVMRRDMAGLPRLDVPALHELPVALGWMYVLEAATLDGRALRGHLAPRLPLEIESAAAYLDCYGKEVENRWIEFGEALDDHAARTGTAEAIVDAAIDCCDRVQRWLHPTRIRARLRRPIHA